MTAVTARGLWRPTISDGDHPSLHIDLGISLPPMPLGLPVEPLCPRQQQMVGVLSETDGLTDAARLLGTSLSGLAASVRSIVVRLVLARPTELETPARHLGPQFSQRRARRPAGTVQTLHGNDKEAGLRTPLAIAQDITDGLPLAGGQRRSSTLQALGRLAGGTDHVNNDPPQRISDELAFLANIWRPTTRAWSCHCRA
jgi:hypothetical protein